MSAADSLITLYDFEGQIEPAVESILESNLLVGGVSVEKARGTGELTTPRIDVALQMGPAEKQFLTYKGGRYFVMYNGFLFCTVVTERDTNSNAHGLLRAQLRLFMQYGEAKFNNAGALKYHALRSITEQGTDPRILEKDNCDQSIMKFATKIEILATAFPP